MNPRVQKAEYLFGNKLKIEFRNGECRIFDFSSYLEYPVYSQLADPQFVKTLIVQHGTVCWGNEIDFDPDTLYLDSIPLTALEVI